MNIGIFEDPGALQLLPLTWLRTPAELLCGCDRLLDKVQSHLGPLQRIWTRPELAAVTAERLPLADANRTDDWLLVNAAALVRSVAAPSVGEAWIQHGRLVAVRMSAAQVAQLPPDWALSSAHTHAALQGMRVNPPPADVRLIEWPWDLIAANRAELLRQCRPQGAKEAPPGVHFVGPANIQLAPDVMLKPGVVLDAADGPIRIDAGAQLQPGAVLCGPCYIGPKTIVRPTAVIRENTSVGPVCRVGGEIEAAILLGYSNKQHDGFLGHSYLASWVNLGAGTITSDLKNTYGTIRVAFNGTEMETGQRFLGAIIGDHAKTAIGTMLPTGCMIGVAANVLMRGPVPKFTPSFGWLTDDGLSEYRIDKALALATTVLSRRNLALSAAESQLLSDSARRARVTEAAGWSA